MNAINIPFSGITRNTDIGVSNDGECIELINLRISNGSVQPVSAPQALIQLSETYDKIFLHTGSGYENYICVLNDTVDAYIKKDEGLEKVSLITPEDNITNIRGIQTIGNTISILSKTQTDYFLFKDREYSNLKNKPSFPILRFSLIENEFLTENTTCNLNTSIKTDANNTYQFDSQNRTIVTNSILGLLNKKINEASSDGYIVFPIVLRYALRLYDGNYILHSAPLLLLTRRRKSATIGVTDTTYSSSSLTSFKFDATVFLHKLHYMFDRNGIEKWKDIVTSIDVFVSKQVKTIDLTNDIESFTSQSDKQYISINMNMPGDEKIKEDILEASSFYKIHSVSLDDPVSGYIQKEGMLDNLEQKEVLSDDGFTHNDITGVSYVYNSRLHIGNTKIKLTPLYPSKLFTNTELVINLFNEDITPFFYDQELTQVELETEDGNKIVHRSITYNDFKCHGFEPLISYPDYRARKITISFVSGGKNYYREFPLQPHPYLNLAYNLDKLEPLQLFDFIEGNFVEKQENNIEYSSNKIKVSEVNNPFYFPAKNTYTPTAADVLAICSNTAAISQGQFGQYPLYIFCSDGIYSLSPGSGDVVYTSSAPVTRDVITNPNVLPIDNAVIFVTSQGLMAIAGATSEKLSTALDGWPEQRSSLMNKILSIPDGLSNISTEEKFIDYLTSSNLGFNYVKREIIVSNQQKEYSYILNLPAGTWSKLSGKVSGYVQNSYPDCQPFDGDIIYNMDNQELSEVNIALLTRPIKLNSTSHKKIFQSALRGLFYTKKIGFYLLGSNDGLNWKLISGKESVKDIRDMVIATNRSMAYKYFSVGISGKLRSDSCINFFEAFTEEAFNNRLR